MEELRAQLKIQEAELEKALNDAKHSASSRPKGKKKKTASSRSTDIANTQQLQGTANQQKATSERPTTGDSERDKVIVTIGKQWALHELFQDTRWFMQPRPDEKYTTESTERYTSDAALTQCIIHELYQLVPPALHSFLKESLACRNLVSQGQSIANSNSVLTPCLTDYFKRKRLRTEHHLSVPQSYCTQDLQDSCLIGVL